MSEPENLVLKILGEMRSDMAAMKGEMSLMKADLAEVKSDLAEVKSDMSDLKAEFSDMKLDFRDLRAEFASHKADVTSDIMLLRKELGGQIVELRRAVIGYHTSVVGHGVLISELDTRLTRVERHLDLPSAS